MEDISDILVPAFVNHHLGQQRCHGCERDLGDSWIRSAGARLDDENRACFFVSVWCRHCETRRDFTFTGYRFMREEWWYDIAAWVGDAARPDRVYQVLSNLNDIPGVNVLLRERGKIKRLCLVGAYAGETGPILFLYRRYKSHPARPYGAARLDRGDRLRFLPTGDHEALPVSRWLWFSGLPAGARFRHRGRPWQKLSVERIREIVLDRVFEPWAGHQRGGGR